MTDVAPSRRPRFLRHSRIARALTCLLIAAQLGPVWSAARQESATVPTERPLTGAAYQWADAAYKAYKARDFAKAVAFAEKAARQRPDLARLRKLVTVARAARDAAARTPPVGVPATAAADTPSLEKVYGLLAAGEKPAALALAQDLVRRYPDDQKAWQALVNALALTDRLEEANKAASDAVIKFGLGYDLLTLQESVRRQASERELQAGTGALERKEFDVAVAAMNKAIAYAPDVMDNRLLLVTTLLSAGRYEEAQRVANDAVNIDPEDVLPRMLRGIAGQQRGHGIAAREDFHAVLATDMLASFEQKYYRLILADSALAAREPQTALELLKPLADEKGSTIVEVRRRAAVAQLSAETQHAAVAFEVLRPPVFDCRDSPYGRECSLSPAVAPPDPAYLLTQDVYAALQAKDGERALRQARQALRLDVDNANAQQVLLHTLIFNAQFDEADLVAGELLRRGPPSAQLLALRGDIRLQLGQELLAREDYAAALDMDQLPLTQTVQLLAKLDRKVQARQRLEQAFQAGERPALADLDLAYLAIGISADDIAGTAFERADQSGKMRYGGLQDAAYTAMRVGKDQTALDYFVRAADMGYAKLAADATSANGESVAPPDVQASADLESLLGIRRNIAELSRQWGATASFSYRGVSAPMAWNTEAGAIYNDSAQVGAELYWRPLGYRNGKLFEVYARAMETPYSRIGGLTGADSLQGSVGMRWKPWESQNLLLALNRVFPMGSRLESDWLVQALYSGGVGTQEPRADVDAWWTAQYYAEAGRYTGQGQTFASTNARLGRSYRLDSLNPNVVVFPHVVVAADYASAYAQPNAVGAGVGVNLRYGYRQDRYHAHRSYTDVTLQYRASLSGDEQRAKGFFLTVFWSY